MHLKQLAVVLLCSAAMVAPAFAQGTTAPPPGSTAPTPRPSGAAQQTSTSTPATGMTTTTASPSMTTTTGSVATTTSTAAPMTDMTNINTASARDLDKLPQIGRRRAAAIIKARPYKTTDDLLTRKVLPKGVYDKIKDKITI